MEKPFYISQLPEKTQAWIKEKTKENFLKDGMSEEEAEQKATDFLDEKVNVAEDFFGKDFYKSVDAIKDNFTPPGAKDEVDMTIYKEDEDRFGKDALKGLTGPRESEQLKDEEVKLVINKGVGDVIDSQEKQNAYENWMGDAMLRADKNHNGEIEKDEMADFQKSLDDYATKNKKGREDIPATYKR